MKPEKLRLPSGLTVEITTGGSKKSSKKPRPKKHVVRNMTSDQKVKSVEFKKVGGKLFAFTPRKLGGGVDKRWPTEYEIVRRTNREATLSNLDCSCPAKLNFKPNEPCKHMRAAVAQGVVPPVGRIVRQPRRKKRIG